MQRTAATIAAEIAAKHADSANALPMTASDAAALWALTVEWIAAVRAETAAG